MSAKDISYNEIESASYDWANDPSNGKRFSGNSVQTFIKRAIAKAQATADAKVGYIEYSGGALTFYEDETKQVVVGNIVLSGTVYSVSIDSDAPTTFNVLSSETSKSLAFSASTLSGPLGSDDMVPYVEDYTYIVSVDSGTGTFTERQSGSLRSGSQITLNVRSWLTTGENRLRIAVVGNDSHQQSTKVFTINMTTLYLDCVLGWHKPWIEGEPYYLDNIRFSGNLQKTLYVSIDDDATIIEPIVFPSGTNYTSSSYSIDLSSLSFSDDLNISESGIHTIELWMEGGGARTASYKFNVMCVLASEKNTAQLIVINNAKAKASNYLAEELFQYAVYNVTSVTFDIEVSDGVSEPFTDTKTESGIQTRTKNTYTSLIEFESQNDATLTISITAGTYETEVEWPIDNATAYIPVSGATFYMNAATMSNGSANRNYIINQAVNAEVESYEGEWTGFSYGTTDGWTNDGKNNLALVAKAGCHISFEDLKVLSEIETQSITIELKFRSDNIADYNTPVLTFGETVDGKRRGIYLYPTKLTVLSNSEQNETLQSIGLEEGAIHHIVIVFQRNYGGHIGSNLCSIYMNGTRNITFSYGGDATFGNGYLEIGQRSTDFYLYMMRFYMRSLESGDVLTNFINTIVDGSEFTRSGVRAGNDILDGGNIDYEMAKKAGYRIMVVASQNTLPSIESSDSSGKVADVTFFYGNGDLRNVTITNCAMSGQGTTSMQYYRWNLRFKTKDSSVWSYADGSTSTGKKGYFDGKNVHPKVADIVAKKNYASAMQGHKMGAVGLYDDLYKKVVGAQALPTDARVAVYQYSFLGFQKFNDGTYQFIGLYTAGPHKGDKGTFGYDDSTYPALMSLEGPNHAPLGTRFLHPWKNVAYDAGHETLTFGGEEGWDADFIAGKSTDDMADAADILAMYESEWKPAYEIVFYCSPYLASLEEIGENVTIEGINADVSTFRSGSTNGIRNDLLQVYEKTEGEGESVVYNLYAYNNASQQYELLEHSMISYLSLYLNSQEPTTEELIEARRQKFRFEANNYWATDSLLFHYCFCILIGATDNFAKNMYPFKFRSLADGGRWAFRQDDLDSILDTDNNGQQTKKYSVLPGDLNNDGVQIYQGGNSVLCALIRTAFEGSINNFMQRMVSSAGEIAGERHIAGTTTHETLFNVFESYFWSDSADYFPAEAYNKDSEWSYVTPWLADPNRQYNNVYPLTQVRGDAHYSEREWVKKHIAFIFSRFLIGGFTGGSQEYGQFAFTPINDFTYNLVPAIDLCPVITRGADDIQGGRTLAGVVCPITVAAAQGETNVYIHGTDWLSYYGDMCGLKITDRGGQGGDAPVVTFTGKRLKKIKVGDEVAENVLFNSIGIAVSKDCIALEEVDARNTVHFNGVINLSSCKRLRRVLLEGSTATGLILPEGAQLEEISFPSLLNTLFLKSLPNITNSMVSMDLSTMRSIRGLYVQNCPHPDFDPMILLIDLWKCGGNLQYITMMWDEIVGTKDYFIALYYIAQNKAFVSEEDVTTTEEVDGETIETTTHIIHTEDRTYGYVSYDNGVTNTEAGTPIVEGSVYVDDYISATEWEVVHNKWPNLIITCRGRIIEFEDDAVKEICVSHWGGVSGAGGVAGVEGELTIEQAEKVTSLGTYFQNNSVIESFNELRYFGIKNLGNGVSGAHPFLRCTNLKYLSTPHGMTNFGEINNCKAIKKIIFNEGYTTGTYSMFASMTCALTLVLPKTLTSWSAGSIYRDTNGQNYTYVFKGNVGNFSYLKVNSTGSASYPLAVYVPDEYLENYKEYFAGSPTLNRLHKLSEWGG